jgi:formylglycine-generating enzyme required for sulfatase activity
MRLISLLTLLALTPVSAGEGWPDIDAPLRTGAKASQDAAVVIGNEDYQKITDVPYAGADAAAFRSFLLYTRGVPLSNLQVLSDASPKEMERAVQKAASQVGPEGVLWVYYAGHGAAHPVSKERVLLGSFATLDPDPAIFEEGTVSLETLKTAASSGPGQPVFVVDACYSGTGRDGGALGDGRFAVPLAYDQRPEVIEWTATQPSQVASPLHAAGHGAFTYFAVGALRGWADGELGSRDGEVTLEEAQTYVSTALLEVGKRHQTPAVVGEDALALVNTQGLESPPDLQSLSDAQQEEIARLDVQKESSPRSQATASEPDSAEPSVAVVDTAPSALPQRFTGLEVTGQQESATLGKLVCISPGTFTMGAPPSEEGPGDDEPQHEVTLTRGFCVMESEVTQGMWASVMGSNPSNFLQKSEYEALPRKEQRQVDSAEYPCTEDCPVEMVSWLDAVGYANAVSQREGLTPAYTISGEEVSWNQSADGYRLLTEAEWEAAARGREYTLYAGSDDPNAVAWCATCTTFSVLESLHTFPVCEKQRNGYGLCDMSGNVSEMVWDCHADYTSGSSTDPTGPDSGRWRVDRGGHYGAIPEHLHVTRRSAGESSKPYEFIGFRLARSSP